MLKSVCGRLVMVPQIAATSAINIGVQNLRRCFRTGTTVYYNRDFRCVAHRRRYLGSHFKEYYLRVRSMFVFKSTLPSVSQFNQVHFPYPESTNVQGLRMYQPEDWSCFALLRGVSGITGREKQSTRRKPSSKSLHPPQIP